LPIGVRFGERLLVGGRHGLIIDGRIAKRCDRRCFT
jgi:hypothetical protein